jgi:hypothetical protein
MPRKRNFSRQHGSDETLLTDAWGAFVFLQTGGRSQQELAVLWLENRDALLTWFKANNLPVPFGSDLLLKDLPAKIKETLPADLKRLAEVPKRGRRT